MKRTYLLFLIPIVLVLALWSAVGRVGWQMPIPVVAAKHGYLMASGLLGSLISIERTFILKQKWWLIIPVLNVCSVVSLLLGYNQTGFSLQVMAATLLSALYLRQWFHYKLVFLLGLLFGSLAWVISGVVLLNGGSFAAASIWYILFLLYTITAERLELTKFIPTPAWAQQAILLLFILLFLAQLVPFHLGSSHFSGILMAAVGLWLVQFDIVRINLRKKGFFLYTGSTLFGGYLWLMLSGVLMALPLRSFYHYDAVLHSFFIGFVFSKLFAHAPIIFPALLKITARPFSNFFYAPVALTHVLLLLRLFADYSGNWTLRKWTGLFQVIVFVGFFAGYAFQLFLGIRKAKT